MALVFSFCITCTDKNFGNFCPFFAEISFFGEPRKEKCLEISTARKIKLKSGLSAIFRRKIRNFRFFGGNIGREKHALGGALTEGEITVFSARKSIYRRFIGDLSAVFSGKNLGNSGYQIVYYFLSNGPDFVRVFLKIQRLYFLSNG